MRTQDSSLDFLAGGGEMADRIRAFDWARTPIGPIERWPQSLRSPVGMMLASNAQIILFWGPEFLVLYNDAYRPVFAAKHPRALGLPGREAWAEIWADPPHLGALLEGVVKTGKAFSARDMLFQLERNGFPEDTYFDISYDPVRDESGQIAGVYCIVSETTGRVVGEQRLALLRDLAARNTTARTPREACRLAVEVLGSRNEDVLFALTYIDGELEAATPGAHEKLVAADAAHVRRAPIARAAGAAAGELVIGINPRRLFDDPYRDFAELLAGQLSTAVTNADAYEMQRRRADELAEIDHAKTAFFSNVSHEFRTPLTLMLGPLEELIDRDTGNRETLASIHRNGQRLLKLVNTLLDFARIEAGRADARYEHIDIAAFTADLASNFRSACEKAGLRLEIEVPREPVMAWVDPSMWEKIVLNLLSNAFKFTLEGGIRVQVTRDADAAIRLAVSDTGVGIPRESQARLFERFHRVEGQRSRTHEGSGIGLALVQELVRLQGGRIEFASDEGKGTTFTVELPLGDTHVGAEHRAGGDERRVARPEAYVNEVLGWLPGDAPDTASTAETGAIRVLVADDNADMRAYITRLLASHYQVESAADGSEALRRVRERPPALVVADVMMPGLDGFQLIREIRGDPELAQLPVMLVSARAGEEARLEGMQRGADDYLVKPFTARDLLGRVAAVLQADGIRRGALEHERRFRAFVQASSDAVYHVSPDWTEMRRLDGRSFIADTLTPDASWLERYVPAEDQAVVMRAIHQAIAAKSLFELEHRVLRVDGTVGWTFSRAVPLMGEDGEIHEWLGTASDITARKIAEERLREADRRKDDFLATLSHELRNPLAPLRNGLQLLRTMPQQAREAATVREMMERQLGQLVRLVDDLLELSRVTRGTIELQRAPVDIATVVRNALETTEPAIRAGSHSVEVSLSREPLWVTGDAVRLSQILANVVGNAAKYTADGGRITVTAVRDGAAAVISVSDNGEGIAPDALDRIFGMFVRDPRSDKRAQGGLGVGLTLARHLAELHGGTLEARSEGSGRGSTFVLRLPVTAAPAPASTQHRPTAIPAGLKVLVVDDNRDSADSMAALLHSLGAQTRVAHDGLNALREFGEWRPRVVLLDLGMAGMDGYEVASRIRADFPGERPRLIAITGWGRPDDREKSASAGFDHHLVKPAEIDAVCELLAVTGDKEHTTD